MINIVRTGKGRVRPVWLKDQVENGTEKTETDRTGSTLGRVTHLTHPG